ncbi:hypothetical protein JCM10213v2_004773 [Rhodosporidiobolus nylandii]
MAASSCHSSLSPFPYSADAAPPLSPSAASPLSPELLQSLHIRWLDLGLPRFQHPVTSCDPAALSSSTSSSGTSSAMCSRASSAAGGSALEQDTLAMRRLKAATARLRPPIFRRRSKSLDDADQADAESVAREMRSSGTAGFEGRDEIRIDAAAAALVDPIMPAYAPGVRMISPNTASTASSFASSQASLGAHSAATTVPTTASGSSPYTPCAMSQDLSTMTSHSTGLLTRSASEPMLPSPSYTPAPVELLAPSAMQPLHPPQPAALEHVPSGLSRSYSARDSRLASWVTAVSAASSLSGVPSPAPILPSATLPSTLPLSPTRIPLPPPPRQPYTPVLPSPLSTCSYTSASADRASPFASASPADIQQEQRRTRERTAEDGFPFPPTPVLPSLAGASVNGGESSSGASSPDVATSTRSAPVTSPSVLLRNSYLGGLGAPGQRPPLQSFGSASTTATASSSTTVGTATAAASPYAPPTSSAATPLAAGLLSPRATRAASVSFLPPSDSASSATLPVLSVTSLRRASASASPSRGPSPAAASASHARSASSSYAGLPSQTQGRERAPLTPPESLCTGPFLAGASASELAWHDVLGARIGSLVSAAPAASAKGKERASPRDAPEEDEKKRAGCGELMGNAAAGGFAASTREKMQHLVEEFVPEVPLDAEERSAASDPDALLSFQVLHADRPSSDFRALSAAAEETYLRSQLAKDDRVFAAFAGRPFGAKVLPKGSVSVGFSAMSLHWPSMERKFRVAPATLAHGELMAFLSARATEFKPGGLLTLAYIARSEEAAASASSPSSMPTTPSASPPLRDGRSGSVPSLAPGVGGGARPPASSSPPTSAGLPPRKKDIWAHMTSVLGKAIQRLVSTGLLKPQVARQLLALPLHPRTPLQTRACLRASAHSWDTLHTSLVTIPHPAWKGVEHGTVSPESWADHTIQLLKIFWEGEMRSILREALGSRGACEWVLDCLWTVAKEKLEEAPPHPLELEVQLVALRRRTKAPSSTSTSPESVTSSAVERDVKGVSQPQAGVVA